MTRDARAKHDHVDQGQEALPVVHLLQQGPESRNGWRDQQRERVVIWKLFSTVGIQEIVLSVPYGFSKQ